MITDRGIIVSTPQLAAEGQAGTVFVVWLTGAARKKMQILLGAFKLGG
jgi:hypothetical protein